MLLSVSLASQQAFQYSVSRLQPTIPGLSEKRIASYERMHAEGRMSAEQLAMNKAREIEHARRSANGIWVTGIVTVMAANGETSEASPVPTNVGTFMETVAFRNDEISLTTENGKHYVAPLYAPNGSRRYTQVCAQLVLANYWSPMLELVESREGGKIRVYRSPHKLSDSSAPLMWHELTVEFASPDSNQVVSLSTRWVNEENDIPRRRYDVAGQFGTPGYEVKITHFTRSGAEKEVETLKFIGTTNEFYSLNSIPLGATVVDSRGRNVVTYAWNGQLPEVNSEGDFPVAIWFAAASLLCLGAGVFFWRKR
jgi:hypothetical protein